MTHLHLGLYWVPLLHVPDWMMYMLQKEPRCLLGGYTLQEAEEVSAHLRAFWRAYGQEDSSHPVYQAHGAHLGQCIPYYLYLDEGRGYRKCPVMIVAFEAVLGMETRNNFKRARPGNPASEDDLFLYYLDAQSHTSKGSSLRSRFPITALPHSWYRKSRLHDRSHVFHLTLEAIAKECERLFNNGVPDKQGRLWYGVLLGLKGDSPALAKAGRLNATFMNLGKDRRMCHLCQAGLDNIPWEDVRSTAAWRGTVCSQRPWRQPGELIRIPFGGMQPERLYRNDPFHVVKYGIGRHFTASCLIVLLFMNTWPGESNSVESCLERAFADFKDCCRNSLKACPHVKMFTREILHFGKNQNFPWGGYKGSDTMLIARWLVRLLRYGAFDGSTRPQVPLARSHDEETQRILEAMLDGACAMVHFFQVINNAGLWLTRSDSTKAVRAIDTFCICYAFLANKHHEKREHRFHLEPSLHVYQHMSVRLQDQLDRGSQRVLSPASMLCEAGEDFIGKVARVSRRVSARLTGQRTLQRMCIQMYADWKSIR